MLIRSLLLHPACYTRGLDGTDTGLRAAWDAGKDFVLPNGQYCSVRDLSALSVDTTTIWVYNPFTRKAFLLI